MQDSTVSEQVAISRPNLLSEVFSFPHPANEIAARLVAGMVVILVLTIIVFDIRWLLFFLAYGFLARVLTGPTFSPMGLLATRGLVPLLGNPSKLVAGPPKRFAQFIGLVFSTTALIFIYPFDLHVAAEGALAILVIFAALESFVGFCAGCFVFGYLMKWGLIPKETCERCNNLPLKSGG